jgi:hypothetical protein
MKIESAEAGAAGFRAVVTMVERRQTDVSRMQSTLL